MLAQKLYAGFVELMRLIKNGNANRWQQLRHAGLAHRQVSKKQMVIDDHHIRRQCLTPGQIHVALTKLGALGAQTIVTRRRDQRYQGRALVKPGNFSQIASAGDQRPLFDFGQCPQA